MTVNPSGWRPSAPSPDRETGPQTVTGNRALQLEEPLLFERGRIDRTGVDFDPPRNGEGDHPK
nr:aminomethyl-transferring glycine dehydrogenase subunit GcvPB [Sphingomonas sp.]